MNVAADTVVCRWVTTYNLLVICWHGMDLRVRDRDWICILCCSNVLPDAQRTRIKSKQA